MYINNFCSEKIMEIKIVIIYHNKIFVWYSIPFASLSISDWLYGDTHIYKWELKAFIKSKTIQWFFFQKDTITTQFVLDKLLLFTNILIQMVDIYGASDLNF